MPAEPVDLSRFSALNLDDQVELLTNPCQPISLQLAKRIAAQLEHHEVKQQVIAELRWNGKPVWKLEEFTVAPQPEADRGTLDTWSDSLPAYERNNLIDDDNTVQAAAAGVDPRMGRPYLAMGATQRGQTYGRAALK